MIEFEFKIKHQYGLHTRPCNTIVKNILKYDNISVNVTKKETKQTINGRSIISLMCLVLKQDDIIKFTIQDKNLKNEIKLKNELINYLKKGID